MSDQITTDELLMSHRDLMRSALSARGITLELLAAKLHEELEATEVKVFYDREPGELVYSAPLKAWTIRQRARMDAQELLGLYPPRRQEVSHSGSVELDIHPVDLTKYLMRNEGDADE
jgi:hypothetical protein